MVITEQTKPGNANEALMLTADREMNSDRTQFGSLPFALQFCGLYPDHISHLSGLRVIQNKIYYTVPGAFCRSLNGIAAPVVVLHRFCLGAHRIHHLAMPDNEESLSVNEDEGRESPSVFGIDLLVEMLARKEWVESIFDVSGANIYTLIIEWDVCSEYCA